MSSLVYNLTEAPDEPASVGGKGAALGRLARSGLPVPAGFVLTADAFRAFLDANGLDHAHDGASEDEVSARFRAATWPDALRTGVVSAYEALRDGAGAVGPVAVRSSATAEDSSAASFAGQHATILNVMDLDTVLESVLECWASLYRAEALHYRETRQVEDAGPAMAVVVQTLVPSDASGVAFTLDPVSGDRDLVVVEAAFGLGESVVSGVVTPDHFAVRKSDGAIVRREVAMKHLATSPKADGGTHDEQLSPERANAPALTDEQAVELARIAAGIEADAGAPQDIEWAHAEGRFYILQARPITAVGAPAAAPVAPAQPKPLEEWVSEFDTETRPDTIWTAANVQEVLPDQLSPFSLTVNNTIVEEFGTEPVERMGVKLSNKDPFFAFFYGRPFLNVTLMLEVVEQTPFGSPDALMDQFLAINRDDDAALKDIDLSVLPKLSGPSKLLRYATVTPRATWFSMRMPAEIKRAEAVIAAFEAEDAARPFAEQSDDELLRTFEDGLRRGAEVSITHVSGGGITSSAFEWLRSCTEAWLGDQNGVLQATLCTGLSGLESAQPAYELWELSRIVLASDELREAFASADGTEIEHRVAGIRGIEGSNFRRSLDQFLTNHGHRSVMEAEASAKSWDEDLPTVFAMVRNYLHADPSASPQRVEERQRHQREEATAGAMSRLSFWKRPIFRYVLNQAQEWVISREHTKSLLVRVSHRGRLLTREMARRLVERGLLDEPLDLYWLTHDEVQSFYKNELTKDRAYELIGSRRAEDVRNRTVTLPETFQGRPKPLRPEDQPLPDGDTLHGIAVSPGRVTGKARVILDPRKDATIEPGEILVAPVTDAGWTPLFVAAAGVVVDIGGTLSHGSTVAREYGLPAVVNVKHGTRMITTGQTITVDGTQGVVVLDSAE